MRLVFILFVALLTGCGASSSPPTSVKNVQDNHLLLYGSINQLQQAMRTGDLTAVELTQFYLQRIEQLNPELAAVIEVNPEALALAANRDDHLAKGKQLGLLHGIPILVKDNIETSEQATSAGSLLLKDNHTKRDAPIVTKLRQAGAIILGKTNLSEWANFRSESSYSGWSVMGGLTRNFHNQKNSACGSSSGSAVAVAAGLAVAAIGTETDGSIVCPAHVSGVVGLKPSIGLLSRTHIIPISPSQDTAGPITRNVADSALLLRVMSGYDRRDQESKRTANNKKNYRQSLNKNLRGVRIGVVRTFTGYHNGVDKLLEESIAALRANGAIIVDNLEFTASSDFDQETYQLLQQQFKPALNHYLEKLPNQYKNLSLEKIIHLNQGLAARELELFDQNIFLKAQALEYNPLATEQLKIRLQQHTQSTIDNAIRQHRLDVLITPTGAPAWVIDFQLGDKFLGGYSTYSAVAGYPHLTVPMGYAYDMPVGLSIFAGAFAEQKVLQVGAAFERLKLYQLR